MACPHSRDSQTYLVTTCASKRPHVLLPKDACHRGDPDDSPISMSSPLLVVWDLFSPLCLEQLCPHKSAPEPRMKRHCLQRAHPVSFSSFGNNRYLLVETPSISQAPGLMKQKFQNRLESSSKGIALGAGPCQLQVKVPDPLSAKQFRK